ncbi:hypothetical protein T265_11194 [Opisthorchis viverrini]|uniref:Uncharacterized protein n=1 Tax=Opisthorchis viverrini TaxID=6198 RepID=A0A074Z3X4_OPIVI|nr:hypothetical protein T265_11194 [Opisthorchis viverrini]KER20197.1 hypothetical protein T265_11194 [Opisthorchis viverrini]
MKVLSVYAPEHPMYAFLNPENMVAHSFVLTNTPACETVRDCVEDLYTNGLDDICAQNGPAGLKMSPGTAGRNTEQKPISVVTCVLECPIVPIAFGGTVESCTTAPLSN